MHDKYEKNTAKVYNFNLCVMNTREKLTFCISVQF